jgi:CheY-like chemotaxis protein/cytidylate kinase
LDYEQIDDEIVRQAAANQNAPGDKLARILSGTDRYRDRRSKERLKYLAFLEVALAELIQRDNVIVTGCAGFLIPGNIAHVLRVCLVADVTYRVQQARKVHSLDQAEAQEKLNQYDYRLSACVMDLAQEPAYDEDLYDVVVPLDKTPPDEAVELIATQARSDAIKTTDWSRRAARDFLLSARVKLELVKAGHDVEVFSESGHAIIGINEQAMRMGKLKEKVAKIASAVDGVTEVTTKLGSRFNQPSLHPWEDIDAPPKILLVDDEREFVQTLSERLKTRNLESSIAYDGEQALQMVEDEVPDVIVLDLRMPGIDGIETLRRVKQSHPEVEVIILTGHGSDQEQAEAEDLGAFAYLRKPVNVNELSQVMKKAYEGRRNR